MYTSKFRFVTEVDVAVSFCFITEKPCLFLSTITITQAVGTKLQCAFGALKTTETVFVS